MVFELCLLPLITLSINFFKKTLQKPWYKTALGRFRVVAICEGISFMVLLFIAMPLKYIAGYPETVLAVGWVHGLLFILYMISGLNVRRVHSWNISKTSIAVIASLVPFGPFVLDKKILSKEEA
jgi:integral membrane protein